MSYDLTFAGTVLTALPERALWWQKASLLCVSDLHLGKSDRVARNKGTMLPPYETQDTLGRLDALIARYDPKRVICLGDSFDDPAAVASLDDQMHVWLSRMQAGREWIWIEGNHDPGALAVGGSFRGTYSLQDLTFRHIADGSQSAEISGHYHPKSRVSARGASTSRPCFVCDDDRIMMPAFGTYTGGLSCTAPEIANLFPNGGRVLLTGRAIYPVPLSQISNAAI